MILTIIRIHHQDIFQSNFFLMSQCVNPHFERRVFEFDESVEEWRNKVGVNPSEDDSNRNSKYLQKYEKILSPDVNHLHIPIDNRWKNYQGESCFHKQVIHEGWKCFICEIIFLLNHECLIDWNRNLTIYYFFYFKGLVLESFDQDKSYCSLKFALHINKGKNAVNVIPNKG